VRLATRLRASSLRASPTRASSSRAALGWPTWRARARMIRVCRTSRQPPQSSFASASCERLDLIECAREVPELLSRPMARHVVVVDVVYPGRYTQIQ
jgi:hypothetical protein